MRGALQDTLDPQDEADAKALEQDKDAFAADKEVSSSLAVWPAALGALPWDHVASPLQADKGAPDAAEVDAAPTGEIKE